MNCPVCGGDYSDLYKFFTCEKFDGSFLYSDITSRKCKNCGHIFNSLSKKEIENLGKYYEEEYAPINLSANDDVTDRPGADNEQRYEELFDFILPYAKYEGKILDVGCALGGFIKYCETKGWFNVYGIEPIQAYVDKANMDRIKVGSVYEIPFEDNTFDMLILDQVLEHLNDPHKAFMEMKRVLKEGGFIYISVPNADKYNSDYFYLMREHIQHYNIVGIKVLAQKFGFELINFEAGETKMIGSLKLPLIRAMLKVTGQIYCWGIGREFMYLYPYTRLKHLNLILVDDIPAKQEKTFKGMKIHSSEILKEADENSFLIITASVHKETLTKKAKELGFKGEIIDI